MNYDELKKSLLFKCKNIALNHTSIKCSFKYKIIIFTYLDK